MRNCFSRKRTGTLTNATSISSSTYCSAACARPRSWYVIEDRCRDPHLPLVIVVVVVIVYPPVRPRRCSARASRASRRSAREHRCPQQRRQRPGAAVRRGHRGSPSREYGTGRGMFRVCCDLTAERDNDHDNDNDHGGEMRITTTILENVPRAGTRANR